MVAADAREFLAGTPFAGCEMVTVSARDGRGLDELLAALERAAGQVEAGRRGGAGPPAGRPRLPAQGHRHGRHRHALARAASPPATRWSWSPARARHGAQCGGARPRDRARSRGRQPRRREPARRRPGDSCSAAAGWCRPSWRVTAWRSFDAWVSVLPGARPLRSGDQVRLHHGTAQFVARVAPVAGREIAAGTRGRGGRAAGRRRRRGAARPLHPARALAGRDDRRRGRRWSRRAAAGTTARRTPPSSPRSSARRRPGGHPRAGGRARPRGLTVARPRAGRARAGEAGDALAALEAAGGLEALRAPGAGRGADAASGEGRAARAGSRRARSRRCARASSPAPPSAPPLIRSARSRARPSSRRWRPTCRWKTSTSCCTASRTAGELVAGEGGYAPAGAGVLGDEQAALAEELLARLSREPFAPPTLASLADEAAAPSQGAGAGARRADAPRGRGARSTRTCGSPPAPWTRRGRSCSPFWRREGRVTLAGFRDRVGCGRRNAQALLESFDREGLTLRRGDERIARRRRT